MPRAFSTLEKENIRKALIAAAVTEISRNGFRKLSIDALVNEVHISKGAFYLFYSSKEALIFDAIRYVQDSARQEIWATINQETPGRDDPIERRLLQGLFMVFTNYPIFEELSNPDNLIELVRGLPQDAFDEEFKSDEEFFRSFFAELVEKKQIRNIDLSVLCGLPRMVFALQVNKEMIGLDRYDELKEMFISGMARELRSQGITSATASKTDEQTRPTED